MLEDPYAPHETLPSLDGIAIFQRVMTWLLGVVLVLGLSALVSFAFAQQGFRIPAEQMKGFASGIRSAPAFIDARVLAANVNETHTVPAAADALIFSSNCAAFYAVIGPTAAVPAADVTDGTASELNPSAWYVGAATQIGIIAPTICIVTLSWYKLVKP